ncbi:hypothetical protein [Ruania halotolerans]|uniref:hypothetical protein n=1 Tax=Ruania halotolerans TaxID=2897773 RepID=UPI001E5156D1|nr:hypothetical protein [Ruania halotolerans]UFU05517.1 hypothetical protein LQF10_13820 [Ruania halotolerans]
MSNATVPPASSELALPLTCRHGDPIEGNPGAAIWVAIDEHPARGECPDNRTIIAAVTAYLGDRFRESQLYDMPHALLLRCRNSLDRTMEMADEISRYVRFLAYTSEGCTSDSRVRIAVAAADDTIEDLCERAHAAACIPTEAWELR